MLQSLLMSSPDISSGLSVDNPFVLGPIAAFVFVVFVMEIIVPGKAYRREVEENNRLRALVEKVVPLAETLVNVAGEMTSAIKENARAFEHIMQFMRDRDSSAGGTSWKK